jgi:hypothetical protein
MPLAYENTFRFRDVSARELRRACEDALDELRWRWEDDGRWRLIAYIPFSLSSYGEWLMVEIWDEELVVRSQCRARAQLVDWGKNRKNVQRFIDRVEEVLDEELS